MSRNTAGTFDVEVVSEGVSAVASGSDTDILFGEHFCYFDMVGFVSEGEGKYSKSVVGGGFADEDHVTFSLVFIPPVSPLGRKGGSNRDGGSV